MLYLMLFLSLLSFSFAESINELTGTFPIESKPLPQVEEEPSTGTFPVAEKQEEKGKDRVPTSEERPGKKVPTKTK